MNECIRKASESMKQTLHTTSSNFNLAQWNIGLNDFAPYKLGLQELSPEIDKEDKMLRDIPICLLLWVSLQKGALPDHIFGPNHINAAPPTYVSM